MKVIKTCMQCGHEIEDDIKFDNTLVCSKCGSGDIEQPTEINYNEATLEECFIEYFINKIASVFNADKKEIIFVEE